MDSPHKSYGEFFLARYLANELGEGSVECLHTRRLTPEIITFMSHMADQPKVQHLMESILQSPYSPFISENALLCLYGFRRAGLLNETPTDHRQAVDNFAVSLPSEMHLRGAQLTQISLEGATLIGADFAEANLSEAILNRSNLTGSNISNANFTKTQLVNAGLSSSIARFTSLVRSNCEGADFRDVDLTGADVTDSYLLNINYEGAVFNDVTWTGALVPEELRKTISVLSGDIKRNLQGVESHSLDEYWQLIEPLVPYMLRIARLTSLMVYLDPEDIVQDAILRLSTPPHLDRLIQADANGRRDYVYSTMRRMLLAQETKLKRDEGPYPEEFEDWFGEEEDFTEIEGLEEEPQEFEVTNDAEDDDLSDSIPLVNADDLDEFVDGTDLKETELEQGLQALMKDDAQLAENMLALEMKKVLSDKVWQMVSANYIYGYSIQEIAEQEGLSTSYVKNLIDTGRSVLREHYRERIAPKPSSSA